MNPLVTPTISKVSLISDEGTICPKLSNMLNGAENISPPSANPSVKGEGFKSLKLAAPEEPFIIELFKSEIRPVVDVQGLHR